MTSHFRLFFFFFFFLKWQTQKSSHRRHVVVPLVTVSNLISPANSVFLTKVMLFDKLYAGKLCFTKNYLLRRTNTSVSRWLRQADAAGGDRHAAVMPSPRSSCSDCRVDLVALQSHLVQECKAACTSLSKKIY